MDEAWAEARSAWEAGERLGEVAERLGLARSTLYQRAQAWRAEGVLTPPPAPFDPWCDAAPSDELLALAKKRATHAVRTGKAGDALAWMRLVERLEGQMRREDWADKLAAIEAGQRGTSPDAAERQATEIIAEIEALRPSLDSAESSAPAARALLAPQTAPAGSAQARLSQEAWRKLRQARAGSAQGPPYGRR